MDTITCSKIKKMSPQLLVVNIDASIEFYTKQIGFDLDFRYEDFYAGVSKDGYSIHLKSGKPSFEERQNKLANDDLDIVFSIEGVEDLYSDFVSKSIQITQPLCDRPYGKEFYIADPDGYILAFLEEA
ncbi:MAG: VOC family protein [Chitinophagaceae bacterium]|nr:VOC family protein [Chitinophagaceae bacterium]